ncbi:MAG: hypothetical protein P8Y15_14970, partial [Gemmatimonadales bacterium]
DGEGRVLGISGGVDEDGHVDPMAHVYKSVILDRGGKPIDRRNAADIHVTAAANVIGPGTADVGHFEFTVPAALAGKALTLRARLLWRKFNRGYSEFAFVENPEGFKRFSDIPDLPITEIASDEVELRVGGREIRSAPPVEAATPSEWTRYNDYASGGAPARASRRAPEHGPGGPAGGQHRGGVRFPSASRGDS